MTEQQFAEFQARMDAMAMVIRINNPEKYAELMRLAPYWAPETRARNYSSWVNTNYPIDTNDLVSLNVYSLLMNMPIYDLIAKIENDYGSKSR